MSHLPFPHRPPTPAESLDGTPPRAVAEPDSPEDLAQTLAFAHQNHLSVIPTGGRTKLDWGHPPTKTPDLLLSTRRLNQVLEHAASDMTATVQAGCTVAQFAATLAQRGQRLALDPLFPDRATIGGILATNDSGPLAAAFGTLRVHLLGITIALPDGTLAKSGGKVVKNVAGYDLPRLLIGSFGTLGVITQATFRLYPQAHARETLRFTTAHENLPALLAALAEQSAVTTAIQLEARPDTPPAIQVLVEGLSDALPTKIQRVLRAAETHGATRQPAPAAWTSRERLFEAPDACVCKLNVLTTHWPHVLTHIRESAPRLPWQLLAQIHGIGLLQLPGIPTEQAVEALSFLRAAFQPHAALLTILRAPAAIKQKLPVWPALPNHGDALPLMRRIKAQFDPHNILSPGRFVGGI